MEIELQLDLATMALKGKRHEEAERLYLEIVSKSNLPEAWVGMGICKLYQLANGRTMDEIIFCFEKALKNSPESIDDIEGQLMLHTMIVLNAYSKIVEEALNKQVEEKNKAIFGAVLTSVSFIAGMNSKSAFGTITALSGTGAGVGVAVDSLNNISNYDQLILNVLGLCDDAKNGVIQFVRKDTSQFNDFSNQIKLINDAILTAQNAIKDKDIASKTKNLIGDKISNIKSEFNFSKSILDIKEEYSFSDDDLIRISFLANNHKAISMSNFKQNEEYKKELNSLFSKYKVGLLQRGNIINKLKSEPIH